MTAEGFGIKNIIRRIFNDYRVYSEMTVIPRSRPQGDYGGYQGVDYEESSSFTIKVVPANYIQMNFSYIKFGDLEEGELRFFTLPDYDIEEESLVEFNNVKYIIKRVSAYWSGNEKVAQVLIIHRKF
jgi:hypothetical protein